MKTCRDLNKLDWQFKLKVEAFLDDKDCKRLWVFITESYRSKERQQYLFNSWRIRKWPILTWTLNSMHCKWLAIDIACNVPWKLYPKNIKWWNSVYAVAEKYNIRSLYKTHWVDKPHLEDNWEALEPDDIYKTNQKQMEDLRKQFGDNQLDTAILVNSNLWKSTDNPELKEKLQQMNEYLRSLKLTK